MPIIPSNWIGLSTVNAIGSSSSSKPFKYVKSFTVTSDNLTDYQPLIGKVETDINREIGIEVISGKIDFYWVNYNDELFIISQNELVSGDELKDANLDCLGISFKCYENSEFFVTLRWDSDINFLIYSESSPPEGLNVTINDDITTFTGYQSTEEFTVNLVSGFTYSGNPWTVSVYFYSSFSGTYELYSQSQQFGHLYGLDETNASFNLPIDFNQLTVDGYTPSIKFLECYEHPDDGLVPNANVTLIVSYDSVSKTFNVSK